MSNHLQQVTPVARLLGREVISTNPATGEVRMRFEARADFANRHGTVQGGMLAAMLDSATGNAVLVTLPPGETVVTTRLDTHFLKPAALGEIFATGRLVSRDERSAQAEAELSDANGQIVATARAELRIRPRRVEPAKA